MSWKFAGIIFKKDYKDYYPDLLKRLEVRYSRSAGGFTFSNAINRENRATALGCVNGSTMLLDHLIPYDCSYELGGPGRLDKILSPFSLQGDIMNYIIDGVSETYCFSLFSKGVRIRRWATETGHVLCNEGKLVNGEEPAVTNNAMDSFPDIFAMSEDEIHLFAIWEAFLGVPFQELVQNDTPLFHVFI